MTYPPRSEYAAQVYAMLADHQVCDQLSYDGDRTVIAASVRVFCSHTGTYITFPDPYDNDTGTISMPTAQPSTAVVAVVEGLLTTFTQYLTELVTTDAPFCCAWPMQETPQTHERMPELPAAVQRVFRCTTCNGYSYLDPADGQVWGLGRLVT